MSTEPFIGEIKIFGFNFAPRGYAFCSGQIMSIAQNTALFSLLGTTYGGNGQTTFALPNLNGRVAIGQGQSGGTSNYQLGQIGGVENETMTLNNLPAHAHTLSAAAKIMVQVSGSKADSNSPAGSYLGTNTSTPVYSETPDANEFLAGTVAGGATDAIGGNTPFSIVQPYLALNYSIALEGIFPSRS